MSVLEYAEKMFWAVETMDELKGQFAPLYKMTAKAPDEQVTILNLYNSRKGELEAK
jgi:hypothetical protein